MKFKFAAKKVSYQLPDGTMIHEEFRSMELEFSLVSLTTLWG